MANCPCCGQAIPGDHVGIDLLRHTVSRGKKSVYLRRREMQLFKAMWDIYPAAATMEELREQVWGSIYVASSNLTVNICRLRQALKPLGISVINTSNTSYHLELKDALSDDPRRSPVPPVGLSL